ncbi:MAG: hypothetical protein ACREOR_08005 [Candidatus Binatia bacterium]
MFRHSFHLLAKRFRAIISLMTLATFLIGSMAPALAMNSVSGGALPQPLPLFPADNWWNLDISNWPVDANSASFISFIGTTRQLHPDFGGNDSTTQYGIYGMPYAIVTNGTDADLKAVQFQYSSESDGVNHTTNTSFAFYPIPPEAITEPYWIEGGSPGNVDQRCCQDRHLLMVDGDRNYLYELYNVFYNTSQAKWYAGSGAFFDMNTNNRRPDTWTSADAAGLAILPGLVRYDEVYNPTVTEIRHALRVTVRATNGYVYPASHQAGSTAGALPMGARLRLKSSVDVTQKSSDPNIQKIFRAMQTHGLIVADNGSDLYITGTYDTRWSNDILNPAFGNLRASDFEVIQLGYNPTVSGAALSSVSVAPSTVIGGQSATGTVNLTGAAPAGGAAVSLSSANPATTLPASVTVPTNATSVNFPVTTSSVSAATVGNITANYDGVTKSTTMTVNPEPPPALSALTLNPTSVRGGVKSVGTVTFTAAAPTGGLVVNLSSNNPIKAAVPSTLTVAPGNMTGTFNITTAAVNKKTVVTITAAAGAVVKTSSLTIVRR